QGRYRGGGNCISKKIQSFYCTDPVFRRRMRHTDPRKGEGSRREVSWATGSVGGMSVRAPAPAGPVAPHLGGTNDVATMIIEGERVGAASGQTYQVTNPATGEVVDEVPSGGGEDVARAAEAAA